MILYLPPGIPILVHGPENTWTIQEARNRGWGYVIDTLDDMGIKIQIKDFLCLFIIPVQQSCFCCMGRGKATR